MSRSFGEPLIKPRAIPIRENGEMLVDPRTLSHRIHFAAKHPKFEEMQCNPRVRQRVAEMLAEAAESLPHGIDIRIFEGFRPLHQQRFMYEEMKKEFRQKHPEWNKATLHRVTNQISAPPDDPCLPPHTTGGAVDLCLFDMRSRTLLDMTSPFEWDETSAPTVFEGLSDGARKNRSLLIRTLEEVGLTNYAGEWWH